MGNPDLISLYKPSFFKQSALRSILFDFYLTSEAAARRLQEGIYRQAHFGPNQVYPFPGEQNPTVESDVSMSDWSPYVHENILADRISDDLCHHLPRVKECVGLKMMVKSSIPWDAKLGRSDDGCPSGFGVADALEDGVAVGGKV